jgi:hypothetical protein
MGFFDDVPPPEERFWVEPHRQPEWSGPPENMVGGAVALDLVLANTGDAAISLSVAVAYPTGVELRINGCRRFTGEPAMHDAYHQLRFGVGLPDGRRVVADRWADDDDDATERLVNRGGGGGGLTWQWDYWLWPLPPEGTLQVACMWEEQGIEETVVEIDAGPIRAAAAGAVELWADDRPVS